jgi:hypothetical protein
MTYEGQLDWASGQEYLLFLRRAQTPTRDGFEEMWTEVVIGQSAFTSAANGQWVNQAGLHVAEGEVAGAQAP